MVEVQKIVCMLIGCVVSDKMDKIVIVLIECCVKYLIYGKYVKCLIKLYVYDEFNQCCIGDLVIICEICLLVKIKVWILVDIVECVVEV